MLPFLSSTREDLRADEQAGEQTSRRTNKWANGLAARLEGRQMVCNAGGTEPVNHKIDNVTTINNINLIRISLLSISSGHKLRLDSLYHQHQYKCPTFDHKVIGLWKNPTTT